MIETEWEKENKGEPNRETKIGEREQEKVQQKERKGNKAESERERE